MALLFNGGAYLNLASPLSTTGPNLRVTPNLSIAFWYKSTSTGVAHLINANDGSGYNVGLSLNITNRLALGFGGGILNESDIDTIDGAWHSIVCTRDGAGSDFYVDGALHATATSAGSAPGQTAGGFGIGANYAGGGPVTATTLAHVAIWAVRINSTDIGLYHGGSNPLLLGASPPVGYWKMPGSEASGPVLDSSTSAYHLTVNLASGTLTTATDPPAYTAAFGPSVIDALTIGDTRRQIG